jgi:Chaperone of endosialidase
MESAAPITPPDPTVTAAAQTAANKATAITQSEMNDVNQVGPTGTSTYTQIGTNPDGTPQMQQTTALSAPQQAIFNTGQDSEANLANAAKSLTSQEATQLATPFNLDNSISAKIDSIGKQTLDPQWAANTSAENATLANEGVTPGSEAYNNAMTSFNAAKNNAYDQLFLSGDAQAESESLANQNETTNQISALMNGSQVSTPTFQSTPQTSVAGTDVAGITQNSYLDANQQAQQSVAANNAMMGGLFGLAGTGLTAGIKAYNTPAPSDRRLKTDVSRVGTLDNGLPVYCYRYKAGGPFHIGLMADEVEAAQIHPEAVCVADNGFKAVRYDLATALMEVT